MNEISQYLASHAALVFVLILTFLAWKYVRGRNFAAELIGKE